MAHHLRAEGFDELQLAVEIRTVERLDAAGSIGGKPVASGLSSNGTSLTW